eukprot:430692-Prymnesium_polylepis.1
MHPSRRADQVHRSGRRDGTHPTPRTLPQRCVTRRPCRRYAVRRATLITAPGALRDDASSLTLPSGRATVCGRSGA